MASGTVRPRDQRNWGALRAIDPITGERKWEFRYPTLSSSGVLTTASGLVFAVMVTVTWWRSIRGPERISGITSSGPPCATRRARRTCSTAGNICWCLTNGIAAFIHTARRMFPEFKGNHLDHDLIADRPFEPT
jgi:hypothetical protein